MPVPEPSPSVLLTGAVGGCGCGPQWALHEWLQPKCAFQNGMKTRSPSFWSLSVPMQLKASSRVMSHGFRMPRETISRFVPPSSHRSTPPSRPWSSGGVW